MKQLVRRLLAGVAPPAAAGGVRVLLYHAVDDPDPSDRLSLRVPRDRFLAQMRLLRDEGCEVVPLATVVDPWTENGRLRVVITFDDGYRSDVWAAAVLHELGFPATFFLVPRHLDGTAPARAYWERWDHLRWDEAAALVARGFDVGAHSATHPDLTGCADAELDGEVAGARAILEERLKVRVVHFSYPFGRHDARVRSAVARAGYHLACTSRYGLNRDSTPSHSVRRVEVAGTDTLRDFQWKLAGKYDWLGYSPLMRAQ